MQNGHGAAESFTVSAHCGIQISVDNNLTVTLIKFNANNVNILQKNIAAHATEILGSFMI